MKRFVLLVALLALGGVCRADFLTEATARYGTVDTGLSTKRVWSPELAVLDRFGDSDAHAIGIAYSRYQWSDKATFAWVPPPGSADIVTREDVSARTHWDCVTVRYEYAMKLTDTVRLRVGPGIGTAWAGQSNESTSYGGIAGILTTRYSARSGARLVTECRAVLSASVLSNGVVSAGVLYTHIEAPRTSFLLARAISTTQAIASVGFSF